MATPNTRATFKEYCLRALGKPVIEINVDPDQVEDRIDEALQYFAQYHYDGIERVYLKHQMSQADIDRSRTDTTLSTVTDVDGSTTAVWKEQKNWIPFPTLDGTGIQLFCYFHTAVVEPSTSVTVYSVVSVLYLSISA